MSHDDMLFLPTKMFNLEQRLDNMELILKRWEEDVMRNSMAIKYIQNTLNITNDQSKSLESAIESLTQQFIVIKSQFLALERKVNEL